MKMGVGARAAAAAALEEKEPVPPSRLTPAPTPLPLLAAAGGGFCVLLRPGPPPPRGTNTGGCGGINSAEALTACVCVVSRVPFLASSRSAKDIVVLLFKSARDMDVLLRLLLPLLLLLWAV